MAAFLRCQFWAFIFGVLACNLIDLNVPLDVFGYTASELTLKCALEI